MRTDLVKIPVEELERQDKVYRLWLTGNKNATSIARITGMKRSEVLDYIDDAKAIARNDDEIRSRAKEALHEADAALNMVIERSWETVEQADNNTDYRTKATLLKNIADVEVKRVEMLQKAGLYDDAALGNELVEMEEKAEAIKELLKIVAAEFPDSRVTIMKGLAKIFGKVEGLDGDGF